MKYIKHLISNALKKVDFHDDFSVSKPKGPHGDYTTQVLLKHKLEAEAILEDLLDNDIIKEVDVKNGHINIYLRDSLMNETYELSPVKSSNRLSVIRDRLYDEGHRSGQIPEYFYPLVKKVNELDMTLELFKTRDDLDKDLIKTFKQLDLGYIYRKLTDDELGGIYLLFNTCLHVLERARHE